ncbi:MAG TPA: oxygen-independent coproporphyrinogen III oxidase [Casimicrobiaceae bacterium]
MPEFDAALIARYGGSGPRYTSYPTADRFHAGFTSADYEREIAKRNERASTESLSLYVHLPFCSSLCFYCACNKIITRNRGRSAKYVDYVGREIELVRGHIDGSPRATQLHWGGGTPTFLPHEEMAELMRMLRAGFDLTADASISIEVDPRTASAATIAFLGELGFNRISVGIQDFDPEVQRAVNRIQSEDETRTVIEAARANNFSSINADLIYGLPRQTVAGFARTLDRVVDLSPDRIALYSYAHVPHLFKPQRKIAVEDLPAPQDKLAILTLAIERLSAAGYQYIGMDHFAKPDDELARAQREGRLYRDFQGYSVSPGGDLLAFGVSAIGRIGDAYVQNTKTIDDYYARLEGGSLPVARGITLSADDRLRRAVIQALMCDFRVDRAAFDAAWQIRFADYFRGELASLEPLAADGLVDIGDDAITVTPRGRMLVRAVAMRFDRHWMMAQQHATHSKII